MNTPNPLSGLSFTSWLLLRQWLAILPLWFVFAVCVNAETSWTSASGGDFDDSENWSDGVPDSGDAAVFGLAASYDVDFKGNEASDILRVTGGSPTFNLFQSPTSGYSYTIASTAADSIVVGDTVGQNGTLILKGLQDSLTSALGTSGGLILGNAAGSSGSVTVSSHAQLNVSGAVVIGSSGSGSMLINSGATTHSTGNSATFETLRIGYLAGSQGMLVVSGANTRVEAPSTFDGVGTSGHGVLVIEDGAYMKAGFNGARFQVGTNSGGSGTLVIRGANSHLETVTNRPRFGDQGQAVVIIEDGGSMKTTGASQIAGRSASDSTVFISGQNSLWEDTGRIDVGHSTTGNGTGHLIVTDGGRVEAVNNIELMDSNGGGILYGDSVMKAATVRSRGNSMVSPGLPDWVFVDPLDPSIGVTLVESIGTLTLEANYIQEVTGRGSPVLRIKVGEFAADQLNVIGNITLTAFSGDNPTLEIINFQGAQLSAFDSFQILNWSGTLTGEFDIIAFDPGDDLYWDFSSLYDTGFITVIPEPASTAFALLAVAATVCLLRRRKR